MATYHFQGKVIQRSAGRSVVAAAAYRAAAALHDEKLGRLLERVGRELASLFIDDAPVGAILAAWIAIACLVLPQVLPRSVGAPLLFAGLLAIFVGSFREPR